MVRKTRDTALAGNDSRLLPVGFEDLEPFVETWAFARQAERAHKRWSSDLEEITVFYDAMTSRIEAALDHLDRFDLDAMAPPERRLLYLALSLVEASSAVEVYRQPSSPYAFSPDRYVLTE
jgi:selenocysteine lyase/cysteine desulfurase